MILFFFLVFGLYFLFLILLMAGWLKVMPRNLRVGFSKITVVIPFRNEERLVESLIEDLGKIDYPAEQFEIILVDDHSEDRSVEIVTGKIESLTNFKMLRLPVGEIGKKRAIAFAIENASGDIIATTDADCRIPSDWLYCINECFADSARKMVLGGVRLEARHDFFEQLQQLEFSSLIGVCGATANLGHPSICNGANLAFMKSAFLEVKGYAGNAEIPSGDDEFLMRKIHQRFSDAIYFMPAPDSVVISEAQKSLSDFVQQRLRWAGKWKYNSSWTARLMAVFVLLFQASFLFLVILTFSGKVDLRWALPLVGLKFIMEYFFLFRVGVFLRIKWRAFHFLFLQFVYPLYVIFIGIASFFLSYQWKGRRG